ncbi:MAG: methyltransferase domain-containing protein [Pirellulaceae bacterium]
MAHPSQDHSTGPLQCSVRGCTRPLRLVDSCLRCDANHSFDRAKYGYWSLLQPQDRKSVTPGDCDEAVDARRDWLSFGHMAGLIELIRTELLRDVQSVTASDSDARPVCVADLGCGEGAFSQSVFRDQPNHHFIGLELSKRALRYAARSWPQATWVLANADRTLPLRDGSCNVVTSFFGRRPVDEIKRVLHSSGVCIVAVPGENDLIQLREKAQSQGIRRNRIQQIVDQFSAAGLKLRRQQLWEHEVVLNRDAMMTAMRMTYRAARHSQRDRLAAESIDGLPLTLAADLMVFSHKEATPK